MLLFPMNRRPNLTAALPAASGSFRSNTLAPSLREGCETRPSQPLYNQHFQTPPISVDFKLLTVQALHPQPQQNQYLSTALISVASKQLITLADATLTQSTPLNPFRIRTYEKHRGRGRAETVLHLNASQNNAHVLLVSHSGDTPCAAA